MSIHHYQDTSVTLVFGTSDCRGTQFGPTARSQFLSGVSRILNHSISLSLTDGFKNLTSNVTPAFLGWVEPVSSEGAHFCPLIRCWLCHLSQASQVASGGVYPSCLTTQSGCRTLLWYPGVCPESAYTHYRSNRISGQGRIFLGSLVPHLLGVLGNVGYGCR